MIGILGGMGPAAGGFLHQTIIARITSAEKDSDYPQILLYSNTDIPNRVDAFFEKGPSPASAIIESLNKMHLFGVNEVLIACNTAHIWYDEIQSKTKQSIVHLIDLTVNHIHDSLQPSVAKVLVLGTGATLKTRLYQDGLEGLGFTCIFPDKKHQELVDSAIADTEYGIKSSGINVSSQANSNLAAVINHAKKSGANAIILGCTELSLAIKDSVFMDCNVFDPIIVAADYCIGRHQDNSMIKKQHKSRINHYD